MIDPYENVMSPNQPADFLGSGTKASKTAASLQDEDRKASIVPPALHGHVKEAKIDDNEMELMQRLIKGGINPITNPKKFLEAFEATAGQAGIARTWGPLDRVREVFSPDFQALKSRQQGLLTTGTFFTQELLKLEAERMGAPKTLGEAQQAGLGNIVKPLSDQMRPPGPHADTFLTEPGADPNAPLRPWQQNLAMGGLKNVADGSLMATPDGAVPTSYMAMQGRLTDPETAAWQIKAAGTPGDIQPPPHAVSTAVVNKVLEERGQNNRLQLKPIDYNNRLESLVTLETGKRYGRPMRYSELVTADPALAEQLRQRAEINEGKEIFAFQQDQYLKRQLAAAAPVAALQETARKEADRDQPVQEPQLWRDPNTGDAANSTLTTRQAQAKGFVKLRPDQVETINQLRVIEDGLSEVREISKRLLSPKAGTPLGEAWRAAKQTGQLAAMRATGHKDVVALDSIITRLTAPLVKSQGDTANIAVAEREMFKQALVNNQASTEAVLANIDNVIKASRQTRKAMGFKVDEKSPAKPKAQDRSEDAARQRISELRTQGLSKEDIKKTLLKEGFK